MSIRRTCTAHQLYPLFYDARLVTMFFFMHAVPYLAAVEATAGDSEF